MGSRSGLTESFSISQSSRLQSVKDEFMSAISHELRTPACIYLRRIAQVYEGVLGDINSRQKEFLEIVLKEAII